MCSAEGNKDREKPFLSLGDVPAQDVSSILRIVGILYKFRKITKKSTDEFIENASKLIKAHIWKYSKKKSGNSVYTPNIPICDICSYAAELLDRGDIDNDVAIHRGDEAMQIASCRFSKEWLSNIGILLPQTQDVVKILPFLLTCYSANAPYNGLDPFKYYESRGSNASESESERENYIGSKGWLEIFPEYYAVFGNSLNPADPNLSRNIGQLAQYFIQFPSRGHKPNYSALLDMEGIKSSAFRYAAPAKEFKEKRKAFWQMVKDWELYRRFAAFCDACNEYERHCEEFHINLTLSMALFVEHWEFDEGPEKLAEDLKLIKPITWEDVEADCLYEEIVKAIRFRGSEDCGIIDIHGIVRAKKCGF